MRTLEEVIKAVEEDLECANESYPEVFYDYDNHKDALHYLKEYRETKKHLACLDHHEIRGDNTQVVNNPPLTWDELKTMEGKPVWVELPNSNRTAWGLNDGIYVDSFFHEIITIKVLHDLWHLDKEQMGKTWQAYRKERS
jgi:hypothetical protein